jgi:hypothetical protein
MRQRPQLVAIVFLLALLAGCSRQAGVFSEHNARSHVAMLAGTIGSRPIGTDANARARAYVIDQLKTFGYDVRVQETESRRPELGRSAHVANIIAILPGRRREAIGLLSHYDSAPDSPGAADDGFGVAVSLEAARVLAARPDRQWTTFVLVTDGEESGLMGAAALVRDRDVMSALHTYINVESAGSSGPAVLFEAGPGNPWLTRLWAARAPHPRGGSFGVEVYKRLPNDTDFTLFARHGIPGLNFALVGDGYAYHTARDVPDRLSAAALRTAGENVVTLASALDGVDITQRSLTDATFFDLAGNAALSYSTTARAVVTTFSLVLGVLASIRVIVVAVRMSGAWRWIFTAVWTNAGAAAAAGMMVAATWALRAAREVYHPWYARPGRLFLLLLAVGAASGWSVGRLGRWLPVRWHATRHPVLTWSLALPVWLGLAAPAVWYAPAAAYLWTVPLLAASVLLLITPPRQLIALKLESAAVLLLVGALWLANTVDLLRFATAVLGRLPIITPVYVYAAIIAIAGIMIAPPLIAVVTGAKPLPRPSLLSALWLLAIALTAGAAALSPAYTYEQPLRRHVRALQEADSAAATWEVGSIEPGLDLASGAPGGWTPQADAAPASIPWGRMTHPFVFRTSGPPLGAAPVDISRFTVTPVQAGVELTLTAVPRRAGLAVSLVLPAGLRPARSSLPGAPRLGRWTATVIAPLPEGVSWRASFAAVDANRVADVLVAVTESGFPGGTGWQRLPPWLPQERAVWTAAATWVVAAARVRPLDPVAPLR